MTAAAEPAGFAQDFTLAKDERTVYYAQDEREGNVWLITLSGARTVQ